jgi:hypothetical protein
MHGQNHIIRSIILPVASYGCQTWSVTPQQYTYCLTKCRFIRDYRSKTVNGPKFVHLIVQAIDGDTIAVRIERMFDTRRTKNVSILLTSQPHMAAVMIGPATSH